MTDQIPPVRVIPPPISVTVTVLIEQEGKQPYQIKFKADKLERWLDTEGMDQDPKEPFLTEETVRAYAEDPRRQCIRIEGRAPTVSP